jgi:hypothetical protein
MCLESASAAIGDNPRDKSLYKYLGHVGEQLAAIDSITPWERRMCTFEALLSPFLRYLSLSSGMADSWR